MDRRVTSSLKYQNAAGVYVLVSSEISAVTPANYSPCEEVVRAILSVWPTFRPLWITNVYRSPNGGLEKRSFHALAHYDPSGRENRRIIDNLVLPSTRLYGIDWKHPIYLDDIHDGLSDFERRHMGEAIRRDAQPFKRRRLPRYTKLTHKTVIGVEEHLRQVALDEAREKAQAEASHAELVDYAKYAVKHDKPLTPKSSRTRYVVEEARH